MLRIVGIFLAVLQLAPLCAAQEPGEYIVGPQDVLAITVVDRAELTGKYIVRADGTFTFPLLGRLQAGGLSLQAIENDIHDGLSKGYLKNPQVGVSVDQYRSQQIFVLGEVRTPGSLQFTGSMSIIEALSRAGSTTERAGSEAVIIRQSNSAQQLDAAAIERARNSTDDDVIRVDLETLKVGGRLQTVTLRSGDTIFVPRAESVFVSGQVGRAGEYAVRQGMTVRQVLALAGGVTERGSDRRIQIIRKVKGIETTVGATLQDIVHPGDTVVVRERLF